MRKRYKYKMHNNEHILEDEYGYKCFKVFPESVLHDSCKAESILGKELKIFAFDIEGYSELLRKYPENLL